MNSYAYKHIRRGDIFFADLSTTVGREQDGWRPVIILQNNVGNAFSPTTIVAAITSSRIKKPLPTHVRMGYGILDRPSIVLLEQIRTIDKSRLDNYLTTADEDTMEKIDRALIISLGINTTN